MVRWILACCLCAVTVLADDFFVYTGTPIVETAEPVLAGEAPAAGGKIRICTFNVENFTDGIRDEPERDGVVAKRHAEMIAERVNLIQPDILVMQEVENPAMVKMLNEFLQPAMPVGYMTDLGSGTPDLQKLNLVVLSRVQITDATEIDFGPLQGPGRPTRGLLRFSVPLEDDRSLLVYCVHLKSNYGNRERNVAQRKGAMAILRKDADAWRAAHSNQTWEVVVMGDYNTDPDSPEFATDESLQPVADWVDLWRKVEPSKRFSMPTRYGDPTREFPPVAFDRVVVSPEALEAPWTVSLPVSLPGSVATNDCNALPGFSGHVSDHLPVYVDIAR